MTLSASAEVVAHLGGLLESVPEYGSFRIARMGRLTVPPGWGGQQPSRVDDYHLLYVKGGSPVYGIEGQEVRLHGGQVVFLGKGVEITLAQDPADPPQIITLRFELRPRSGGGSRPGLPGDPVALVLHPTRWTHLAMMFEQLFEAWTLNQYALHRNATSMQIHSILWAIREECRSRLSASPGRDPRLEKARQRLDEEPEVNWRVAELARFCGMSESHFSRRFHLYTGLSPKAYQLRARMRHARMLLEDGDDSLQAIAACLGYSDPFVFSRQFKKAFGIAPSKLRAR